MPSIDLDRQKFYLLSFKCRRLFSFQSEDGELETEVENFFEHLPKMQGGNVYAEFKYEYSMLQGAIDLSDRLKSSHPSIQQLPSYFKQLSEGDYFIRHRADAPLIDLKRSIVKAQAFADGQDPRKYDDAFALNWGRLYLTFETYSYGFLTDKIKLGEFDKDKRVCRFCGKSGRNLYQSEAHAIVEALGNKLLFCNEECDECNQRFEREVEKYLFKFCEIQRTLASVSGKGSQNHHLEGLNFHIHPDPKTKRPTVYVMHEGIFNDLYKGKPTAKIHLYNKGEISYWGIYKSLIKIAVDMIPDDKMQYFKETAKWVHGDIDAVGLPPFLYGEHTFFFEQPVLDMFFRNDRSPASSPYCTCILYVFSSIFIFTVPLCSQDKTPTSLTQHWQLFKRYQYLYVEEWIEHDSNDKTLLTPFYKIPILSNKDSYKLVFRSASDPIFEIKRDK